MSDTRELAQPAAGYTGPLSLGQKRLHVVETLRPGLSAYVMSYALRLDGRLDAELARRVLETIVARHDVLRSSFVTEGEESRVFVSDAVALDLPVVDVSLRPPEERGEAVKEVLHRLALAPFDLSIGPLLRFQLVRLGPQEHVLGLAVHHAICDGQSLRLFRQEFTTLYGDLSRSLPPSLPELPIQFVDFADWESETLAAQADDDRSVVYWRDRLAGAPGMVDLPLDFPRRAAAEETDDGPSGATAARDLPTGGVERLLGLARTRGATPAMAFLAILTALLARWAQGEDFVVALPVSKRSRPELAGLIGLLVDLLPIRLGADAETRFGALLDTVRDGLLDAMRHSEVPFERIVELADVQRAAHTQPFQQVLFGFEEPEERKPGPSTVGALAVSEWEDFPEQDAKADLSFLVRGEAGRWRVAVRYDRALFTPVTASRLLDWFAALCESAGAEPEARLSELALAPRAETLALLQALNATDRPLPHGATLAGLFERAAEARPKAAALTVFEDGTADGRTLDYATLDQRANRLAHYLAARGVRRGQSVALAMHAGVDLVVAILAAVKLGAAYVPLDLDLPAVRHAAMLEAADVKTIVLAGGELPRRIAEGRDVIDLARAHTAIARAEPLAPKSESSPADLAYVMFTSGSTGTPKGVAVPQRAVIRLVCNSDFLTITPEDSVGFASNVSFDASTLEIWGALLNGGRLLHVPRDVLFSATELTRFIARERLTVLWVTKGVFDQLVRSDPAVFNGLRVVLSGGEAANPAIFNRVLEASAGSGLTLLNGYGPTENTTFSTVWRASERLDEARAVPIGRPIANSRAYVLDEALQPVPPGIVGELHVAGQGLADGYAGRSDLTAERFLPDPFAAVPGERMYRTGDRVRQLDDGTIVYLGRLDSQVKIRGFRIELGDISAVLIRHPSVATCHIAVQEDGEIGKRLVAYVVPRPGEGLTADDLRAHLRANLPEFMLPKAIVVLDALPLNANGKIDTRALPAPGSDLLAAGERHEPPLGATETTLAEIWAQVVKLPRVGRNENFFSLGGDSILTIRVAARARDRGLPVTPKLVFQHQTVASLAAAVDALLAERGTPVVRVLPLTGSQYRLARLSLPADGTSPQAPPSGTFWVAGRATLVEPVDAITLGFALRDLRRRHDSLRLRLAGPAAARVLEIMDVPPPVPVSLHQLDGELPPAAAETKLAAILEDLASRLDVEEGTVFRGALVEESPTRQHLLLLVHRLVADEASVALLLDEVGRGIGESALEREPIETPPPFSGWIEKVAAYASAPAMAAQTAAWDQPARRSARFRAALRSAPKAAPARTAVRRLDPALADRLAPAALVPRRISPLEVVLAALAAALAEAVPRQADESDSVLIDVVTDGRLKSFEDLDITGMVGNFSRRFPVVVPAGADVGAAARLADAKSALRGLPDGGLGFELLDRDLHSLPASCVVLLDGLSSGPVPAATAMLRTARVLGRPLIEADAWLALRLERDEEGLFLSFALQDACRPRGLEATAFDHPDRLADAVVGWLRRLLEGAPEPVRTPSDFPLAGLDQSALMKVLGGREAVEDLYPLSPMQESMLIHALTSPDSEIGFEQACHRIDGPLDVVAFQAAWQAALDRHSILRTAFVWEGLARPLQLVHAHVRFQFWVDDWSDLPVDERERRREAFLEDDRKEGFRLDRAPLLRAAIIRVGPDSFLFVTSFHHILLDGWCLPQLEREVRLAYEAAVDRQPLALRAGRPYADYIAWLQRQDLARARTHFESLLAGSSGPTALPEQPAEEPESGHAPAIARAALALTAQESQAVGGFARARRLTVGALLHAAWGLVLMQSSGRRDVIFGTTVSGRPSELPGVETMLGLFINNLPVRLAIAEDDLIDDVLALLQLQLVDLRQHEMVSPLEIETCGSGAGGRLFDSLLVVENVPSSLHEWTASPTLRFTLLSSPLKTRYGLTLVAIPAEGAIDLSMVYDGGRFSAATVAALLAEIRRLLLAMTDGSERRMAALLAPTAAAPLRHVPAAAKEVARSAEPHTRILPRTTVEVEVAQAVEDLLGVASIGVTDDLVALGMTSVTVSRLALRLRQVFRRSVPLTHIITHPTVAQLAASLGGPDSPALAWQPLVPMGRGDPRHSFYCVHPIAGDVSVFFDLARAMAPRRQFVALQAPGLRPGDPEPASLEALAGLYVEVLTQDSAGPIDIGGYSFGGVVAFEIARQMEARGRPVRSVTIIDTPAPTGEVAPDEAYSDAQWLWRMLRVRERFHGVDLALTPEDLERAGRGGYDLVLSRLREAGLLPDNADADLLLRMASVGRRHYQLYRNYRPAPIGAPLAIIRAAEVDASEAAIDHGGKFGLADLGWAGLTRAAVLTASTPGNHITIMRPPDLAELAANLERLLASVREPGGRP
jgi:amino acid adenylation domain-containing protein